MTHHCLRRSRINAGNRLLQVKKKAAPESGAATVQYIPSQSGRLVFYDETRLQDALSGGYCPVEALTGLYLLFLLSLISDFPLCFR